MIKICHLVETLKIGGLEKTVISIALNLDSQKYEQQVWCLREKGDLAIEVEKKGIIIREFHFSGRLNPFSLARLSSELKKEKFTILHSHGMFPSFWGIISGLLAGIPVLIVHCQNIYYIVKGWNKIKLRYLLRFAATIIAVSEAVKESLNGYIGVNAEKIRVIFNSCPEIKLPSEDERMQIRRELGIKEDEFVVGNISRLEEHKGHQYLLDAINLIQTSQPNLKCLIIGDGAAKKRLELYAKSLGIEDKVIFTGWREDINNLLSAIGIFIQPSTLMEGLPISLAEAASAGLPLIATNIGGNSEIVQDEVNGFIIPPCDARAMADKIIFLLNNAQRRKIMADNSRKLWQQDFTLAGMLQKIEKLYDELAAGISNNFVNITDGRNPSYLTGNKKTTWRTRPEVHNTQFIEAMATYHFIKDLVKDKLVLDAGCAFGYGTNYLSEWAKEVVGIDTSEEAINLARKNYPGENIKFIVSDISELDFPDGYFDVVCLFEVVHQVEEYQKMLREIWRILKKDGIFLIATRNRKGDVSISKPGHLHEFTAKELEGLVLKSGFNRIESYGLNRPRDAYLLERELSGIRKLDLFGFKKLVPRKLVSLLVYFISKAKGITPPQNLSYKDFEISKDNIENSPGFLIICNKA